MKKIARITIETETLTVIRHAKAVRGWCPTCQAEVNLITLDCTSLAERGTAAHIREWIGKDQVHVWQPDNGPAHICLTSLLRCFEPAEAQRVFRSIEDQLEEIRRKQK